MTPDSPSCQRAGANERHDFPHLRRFRRPRRRNQPGVDILIRLPEQAFQGVEFVVVEAVQGVSGEPFEQDVELLHSAPAAPACPSEPRPPIHGDLRAAQTPRVTISFLISAIAFAGFSPFGHAVVQFMMVWQR